MEAETTETMRRVRDAFLEGSPVPEDVQAKMTETERAEIRSLTAIAVLTRVALQSPEPSPAAEDASLRRAQGFLAARRPAAARHRAPGSGFAARLARFFGRRKRP